MSEVKVHNTQYELRPSKCPNCGHELDRAITVSKVDVAPKIGDLTVCIRCGAWLEFDQSMRPMPIQAETIAEMDVEQRRNMTTVSDIVKQMMRK